MAPVAGKDGERRVALRLVDLGDFGNVFHSAVGWSQAHVQRTDIDAQGSVETQTLMIHAAVRVHGSSGVGSDCPSYLHSTGSGVSVGVSRSDVLA